MVVMAVREAEAGHRAAPLWVKVLVTAGFAVAAWFVAGLIGSLTASADEAPLGDQHTPAETTYHQKSPQQRGLLGGMLDTTLTTLTSTVDQVTTTVNTTLGTVTNTVDTLTTTVTETTNTVLQPVTATLAPPAPAAPKQQEPTETAAGSQTRIETVSPKPAPVVPPAPQPAPAQPVTVVPQQTVEHKQPQPTAAPYQPATVSAHLAQPKDRHPAPLPSVPGGQSCSAVAAHDSGGNSKHPLAILDARAGATPLASIGVPRRHAQVDNSRDAALPTTSPD